MTHKVLISELFPLFMLVASYLLYEGGTDLLIQLSAEE